MALELIFIITKSFHSFCLNPCSNGMALEHKIMQIVYQILPVLILVLMEWRWNSVKTLNYEEKFLRLNPCSNGMALELLIITFN